MSVEYVNILLCSIATMSFGIFMIRVFITSQWYHFSFLVLSCLFLGHSLGFLLSSATKNIIKNSSKANLTFFMTLLLCMAINLSYTIFNHLGLDSSLVDNSIGQLMRFLVMIVLLLTPPLVNGYLINTSLLKYEKNNIIIGVWLSGLGLGVITELLFWLIYPQAKHLILISYVLIGFWFVCLLKSKKITTPVLLAFLLMVLVMFEISKPIHYKYRIANSKEFIKNSKIFKNSKFIEKFPNAFYTTYLIEGPNGQKQNIAPSANKILPKDIYTIEVNAANPASVYKIKNIQEQNYLENFGTNCAFLLVKNPKVCIIEPQGNEIIALGLYNQADKITLVKRDSFDTGLVDHLLTDPCVSQITDNPYSFIKKCKTKYDIIFLPFEYSYHALNISALDFEENFYFTNEILSSALKLLKQNSGLLIVSLPIIKTPKTFDKILDAIRNSATKNNCTILTLKNGYFTTIFLKNSVLETHEKRTIETFCNNNKFSYRINNTPQKTPGSNTSNPFVFFRNRINTGLLASSVFIITLCLLNFLTQPIKKIDINWILSGICVPFIITPFIIESGFLFSHNFKGICIAIIPLIFMGIPIFIQKNKNIPHRLIAPALLALYVLFKSQITNILISTNELLRIILVITFLGLILMSCTPKENYAGNRILPFTSSIALGFVVSFWILLYVNSLACLLSGFFILCSQLLFRFHKIKPNPV